nr:hypothetical protein [Angustibacter aerolatus]
MTQVVWDMDGTLLDSTEPGAAGAGRRGRRASAGRSSTATPSWRRTRAACRR